jgi:predicted DNA-binding protein (MmcQ/YjbR family)
VAWPAKAAGVRPVRSRKKRPKFAGSVKPRWAATVLDVYKVAGKVFLIVTDDPDEQIITLKCEPEHARAKERDYASITPGRYLDKHHWISLGPGSGITERLITDAVEDSYDLVADRLPRRDRRRTNL